MDCTKTVNLWFMKRGARVLIVYLGDLFQHGRLMVAWNRMRNKHKEFRYEQAAVGIADLGGGEQDALED